MIGNRFVLDIKDFHEKFGLGYDGPPTTSTRELHDYRTRFMEEELDEYEKAFMEGDLEGQLDGLVDLLYVLLGTALMHGFLADEGPKHDSPLLSSRFEEAWNRVHAANMKKERVERADQSKRGTIYDVIKPEGWTPPDLSDLVKP